MKQQQGKDNGDFFGTVALWLLVFLFGPLLFIWDSEFISFDKGENYLLAIGFAVFILLVGSLAVYRFGALRREMAEQWAILSKIKIVFKFGLLVLSIPILFLAGVVMDFIMVDKIAASQSPVVEIECHVTEFRKEKTEGGYGYYIDFSYGTFNNHISVDKERILPYFDKPAAGYNIKLQCRKGLGKSYLVDEWKLIKVK